MALLIFVVPALAIGAVLYALCCMDGADDGHEDVGSDDDADDDKYDAPPPAGATGAANSRLFFSFRLENGAPVWF